jgi:glycolate oxidase FAD binding subunit
LIERPESVEDAAALLRRLADSGQAVEPRGAGTKIGWGGWGSPPDVILETNGLARVLEHNEGDFTAVLQAGVPLAAAQAMFSEAEQMLAVDPALAAGRVRPSSHPAASREASGLATESAAGRDADAPAPSASVESGATVGGVVASGDSGPLRHRYGGVRDLVLGITVVLSDGTVASAGGKVIKNVAGYDLAKLFTGSLGTLGLIASVAVRLHPRPPVTATAVGLTEDPDRLAAAALELAHTPLEADCLDAAWRHGAGRVLVRFGGAAAERQAEAAVARLSEAGLEEVSAVGDDEALWDEQRAGQRSEAGAVLKVSGRPSELARMVRAAYGAEGTLVARAALGLGWIALEGEGLVERVHAVRSALAPRACTLLDAPDAVRSAIDPWPETDAGALEIMRRVKARFDPARMFRPGAFVGGI